MAMETASFLHDLRARSQADPGLRSRLLADPGAALRDLGLALPGGRSLAVVEDTATQVHLPLPPAGAGSRVPTSPSAALACWWSAWWAWASPAWPRSRGRSRSQPPFRTARKTFDAPSVYRVHA